MIIRTIDAHAAGEPLRLIVKGFEQPSGATMLEKRAWVRKHQDHIRRALMREPRGHTDMYGAVLTEPVNDNSHAGVLFMHNEGYSTMCGHGIIAVVTIALERGLLELADPAGEILLDTPAGTVCTKASIKQVSGSRPAAIGLRVERVSFLNVPSFVLHPGLPLRIGKHEWPVDVAFGGAFYAIVDSETVGVPLRPEYLSELRKLGMQIKTGVEAVIMVAHPLENNLPGIYGTIFTGVPDGESADLRNVTIFADAQVDRSPCGTGTAAVMAVIDAMGLLGVDRPFVQESLIGTQFRGSVESRTTVGEHQAIVPRIEGSAWITGEHEFIIDDADPLQDGFRL